MLAIKKDNITVRAITAGCIAFSVGLTGVAAYINSTLEHQNLVFNKEQTFTKAKADTADKTHKTPTSDTESQQDRTGHSDTATTTSGPAIASPVAQAAPANSLPATQPQSTPATNPTQEIPPPAVSNPTPPVVETPEPIDSGLIGDLTGLLPGF